MNHKRQLGQYFTQGNCFILKPFRKWFESIPNYSKITIVDPFAGMKDIARLIRDAGYNNPWKFFDIDPKFSDIIKNDSIVNCPIDEVIITNPPYLAKNSATRRGINFPESKFDDLYKISINSLLSKNSYVASIIPESFITSGLFKDRIDTIISLKDKMFEDTECPVCLALFSPKPSYKIYSNNKLIGKLVNLEKFLHCDKDYHLKFNDPTGEIGLRAIDNNIEASIKFVCGSDIPSEVVKESSRSITKISIPIELDTDKLIIEANKILNKFRTDTSDIFLTAFKGIRKDGLYRRRLDFKIARTILNISIQNMQKKVRG